MPSPLKLTTRTSFIDEPCIWAIPFRAKSSKPASNLETNPYVGRTLIAMLRLYRGKQRDEKNRDILRFQ
jgi:hypothetical protein